MSANQPPPNASSSPSSSSDKPRGRAHSTHPCVTYIDQRSAPRVMFAGDRLVEAELPIGTRCIYPKPPVAGLKDPDAAIRYAINHPYNSPPLYAKLRPGMKVVIAIDDLSMPLPPMRSPEVRERVLTIVLQLLDDHGVDDVEMIIATSLHRRMTGDEIKHIVGKKIFDKYYPKRLYNHDAEDPNGMALVGETERGEKVIINKKAAESDLLIYVNLNLVPMNGGHKSVTVGLCGYESLKPHHNPYVMSDPNTYMDPSVSALAKVIERMGKVVNSKLDVFTIETTINNRMFDAPMAFLAKNEDEYTPAEKTALKALLFTLDHTPQELRQAVFSRFPAPYEMTGVFAGETEAVHKHTIKKSFEQYCVPVEGQADIVISGIPFISPYNVNAFLNPLLVQVMATGYLYNLHRGNPLIKKGGTLIITHPCTDKFDQTQHIGYIDFVHKLLPETRNAKELHKRFEHEYAANPSLIEQYRFGNAYHPVHAFFMWYWGEAGRQHIGRVIVVGADNEYIPKLLGYETAPTMADAIRMAQTTAPADPQITFVHTAPIVMAEVSIPGGATASSASSNGEALVVAGTSHQNGNGTNGHGEHVVPAPAEAFSVLDELRGARIFVVGGTGFLGKVWLSMILARVPDIGKIHLVVRSKKGVSSEARFWAEVASSRTFDPLREQYGEGFEAWVKSKVHALDADVGRTLCGVSGELLASLVGNVDAVVNVAGVVDFNPPLDEALSANAFGVQNLVELARALGDVPILHTSTCYVAGYRNGQIDEVTPETIPFPKHGHLDAAHWDAAREISECLDIIEQAKHRANDAFRQSAFLAQAKENLVRKGEPARGQALEDELARVRRKFLDDGLIAAGTERSRYWGWPNVYTYTKSIGEQILSGSGLRYAIVRPSVIECSVEYPFSGWNEGISTMAPLIFMVLKGHIQVGQGDKTNLDVIPVDYVSAGMIIALAALRANKHKPVYHLGVSDTNPASMKRIIELTGLYKRLHFLAKGTGNPLFNKGLAHIEPVGLTPERFYQHGPLAVAKTARALSGFIKKAGFGPLASVTNPVSKALKSYSAIAQRAGLIWELFLPFMGETEYYFQTHNIRALYAGMSPHEQTLLPWHPEDIDWRHYLLEVQYPGLEKWVNPGIEEKLNRPQKPLRSHDSLVAMLEEQADQHDLAVALQRFEPEGLTRITFRDLKERAECVAARLVAAGVQKGDRVVLCAENHPAWPIAYFGILRAGATAVPVDAGLAAPNLTNVLRASGAKVALFDQKVREKAGDEAVAALGTVTSLDLYTTAAFDASIEPPVVPTITADDVASLIYTSGTTGTPKGVMLTHGNFTSLIAALAPVFPLGKSDRLLSVLPLHHTFEFTCGLLLPLSRGARIVYLDELNGERLAKAMKETRVTAMVGVPALWQLLERRILTQVEERGPVAEKLFDASLSANRALEQATGLDLGRLLFGQVHGALGGNIRYLISGGAALPPDTAKLFAGLGLPLAEGYGLTEASPVLTVAKHGAKPGSVGKPVPGVEIRIDAPNADGVGEVLARGKNVMAGYEGDAEATAKVLTDDGWLRTGDLGKLDRKGALTLVGREKDVIVGVSGENLYPDDIERALGDVAFVEEYSVLGILDPKGGEQAALIGVPKAIEGATPEIWGAQRDRANEALRAAVARLPVSQRPAVVLVYDAPLPRTATRKVKRNEVKALVERLVQAAEVRRDEDGVRTSVVRSAVATIARKDVAELHRETRLVADLGFDSLMTMELMVALEGPAHGRLGPAALAGLATIGEIEEALAISATATPTKLDEAVQGDQKLPLTSLPGPVQDVAKGLVSEAQRRFYGDVMRTRVTGRAFIPQNRNTLVVANHASHLDMGLVWYALGTYGEDLVALAASDYFFEKNPIQRAVLENFTNLAPLDRHAGLKESLREIGKLLDAGKTVLIFPEGTRSTDGQIREFKGAVGHLALKHDVDILPLFLGGVHEAMPKGSRLPKSRDLLAKIGPPLTTDDLRRVTAGLKPAAAARRVAELSQRAVEALRDGSVLDLARMTAEETEPGGPKKHPLVQLFEDLEKRFVPGGIREPVSFYFTLGNDVESKWTVKVSSTTCSVEMKKPENGVADCVLKTSPDLFTRIVRDGFMPGVPEFVSGQIKSNDVSLLDSFLKAFALSVNA